NLTNYVFELIMRTPKKSFEDIPKRKNEYTRHEAIRRHFLRPPSPLHASADRHQALRCRATPEGGRCVCSGALRSPPTASRHPGEHRTTPWHLCARSIAA